MLLEKSDIEALEKNHRSNLINSIAGFKSVNLVGTISENGLSNLAIMSQIFHIGANPALMGLLIRPDSVNRHTLSNIIQNKQYTFNHIQENFIDKAHQTAARYDDTVSEFEATGLGTVYLKNFKAPFVKESNIKIGLQLEERIDLKINGTVMIIGSIQILEVPNDVVLEDGFIDLQKAGTITCNGLDAYLSTHKLKRFSYAKPDKALKEMSY
jgi:flavin reductase (DIM6/NTAB) family NADH-FMN oxidoreductase RutF